MFRIKRYASAVVTKPLSLLNQTLKQGTVDSDGNVNTRTRNLYFKSKILVLIGLIFLLTNLLLSSLLIFSVDNYNNFVISSNKLDLYLDLNRKLFRTKGFLYQFKSFNTQLDYFSNKARSILRRKNASSSSTEYPDSYQSIFNTTYASSAYLSYAARVYESKTDPEIFLDRKRIGFHWADWSDLSPALPFVHQYESLKKEFGGDEIKLQTAVYKICYDKLYDVRDSWVDSELYDKKISVWEHLQSVGVCSAIFKYYYWPLPERILYETDKKYFSVPVGQKRLPKPLGLEGLSRIYYGREKVSSKDISNFASEVNRPLLTERLVRAAESKGIIKPDQGSISLKTVINQDPADFKKPNFDEMYKTYEAIAKPTAEEEKYFNFLKWSKENVEKADKFYFRFPWIKADERAELHHYTFPWIKQIISHEERIQVVHHLIRSWFKFAEQAGIISWFNYGNLIGWYFNSMNLPWDNDVDIQLSIKDLDKIGRKWNNTVVVEDPEMGNNVFWLHTNPYYMQQKDNQFIDARYIDVKTGIYIDISGLWQDNNPPNHIKLKGEKDIAFHCKHYNWFAYSEIFPIRRTIYEGAQAYMVNDVVSNLKKLYGDHPLTQRNEANHNWQEDIGLWVPNEVCEKERVPPTAKRFDEDGQLTLFGACNNTELLDVWKHTKKAWSLHQQEAELIRNGLSTEELTAKSLPVFRFFNHDEYR